MSTLRITADRGNGRGHCNSPRSSDPIFHGHMPVAAGRSFFCPAWLAY